MIKTTLIFFMLSSIYFAQTDSLYVELLNGETKKYSASEIREIKLSGVVSDINEIQLAESIAKVFTLRPNYPNPFNPSTTIEYEIPQTGYVEVTIFDIRGRQVFTAGNEVQQSGVHRMTWNGCSNSGIPVSSGAYFCRIRYNDCFLINKMLLIK